MIPLPQLRRQIRQLLDEAVSSGEELGCQLAVYLDGEQILDEWAGWADPDRTRRVEADTVFPVFSTGKGFAVTALLRLIEQGRLHLDDRVADLWPEFGCNGKEELKVWHILSHRTGLFETPPCTEAELIDRDIMQQRIAEAVPAWRPGTRARYQAITFSWLVPGVAERATGKEFRSIVRDEVASPLRIESLLFYGTTDDAEQRRAVLVRGNDLPPVKPEEKTLLSPLENAITFESVRRACLPGFNCHTTARAIAKHYAALLGEVEGMPPLLSRAMLDRATTLTRAADDPVPLVPGTWELFGLGYVLSGPKDDLGRIFGHGGYGGSEGIADRKMRLAVGYTSNSLHLNPRTRNRIYELLELHSRDW